MIFKANKTINCIFKSGTLIILLLVTGSLKSFSESGDIILKITNLKNKKGYLNVSLFNDKSGFPSDESFAYRIYSSTFSDVVETLTLYSVEYGTYAISVLHDENMNLKLDTGWFGIPKEGVGVSNNAKGFFGPPKYKDAEFVLETSSKALSIEIQYLK